MSQDASPMVVSYARGARALIDAARRALKRGDMDEFARLYDDADELIGLAIGALPLLERK